MPSLFLINSTFFLIPSFCFLYYVRSVLPCLRYVQGFACTRHMPNDSQSHSTFATNQSKDMLKYDQPVKKPMMEKLAVTWKVGPFVKKKHWVCGSYLAPFSYLLFLPIIFTHKKTTHVALANLQWNTCKNQIKNWTSLNVFVMVKWKSKLVDFLIGYIYRSSSCVVHCWVWSSY